MKLGAFDHPKTLTLKSQLKCSYPTVIGHLELLWRFTAQHAPRGNIGKWPDAAIAQACGWESDPTQFICALQSASLVDASTEFRLVVHDWPEHCPQWVRAQLSKAKLDFCSISTTSEASLVASKEPSSGPSTIPSLAKSKDKNKNMGQQAGPSAEDLAFAEIQAAYPKREGSQRWKSARSSYRARIREGYTHKDIFAGVIRYSIYCETKKITRTGLVQQAATFLGTNLGFTEPWTMTDVVRRDDFKQLTDAEIVRRCRLAGIGTTGLSRQELISRLAA